MITATTLRRVGQLNHENKVLRHRMEALRAERDWLLKRLADCHNLMDVCHDQMAEDTTHHVPHYYAVCRD